MSHLTGAKSLYVKNNTVFIATSHGIVFVDVAGTYNVKETRLKAALIELLTKLGYDVNPHFAVAELQKI